MKNSKTLSGILNINKPAGWTSFDVVNKIRQITGVRKVGHAGTLDPFATGVLLVCLGRATKAVSKLMQTTKAYRAVFHLGISTDTYDIEGKIICSHPEVKVDLPQIKNALKEFMGEIEQIPPMYSALKVKGRRLYDLARQGKEITLSARKIKIYRIEILKWENPFLTLEIECSPGTYIRSLANDLGKKLGCGAYVKELVRLRSGDFSLKDTVTLEEVKKVWDSGKWEKILYPLEYVLKKI